MNYRYFNDKKDIALTIDENEDVMSVLKEFALNQNIGYATFTALGAFKKATLGAFDAENKVEFYKHNFECQNQNNPYTFEVLSFIGNISWNAKTKELVVHAHASISDKEGKVYGGHVFSGIVGVTFELHMKILSKETKVYRTTNNRFKFPFLNFSDKN